MNRRAGVTAAIVPLVVATTVIAGCGSGGKVTTGTAQQTKAPATSAGHSETSGSSMAPASGGSQHGSSTPPSNAPATEFRPPGDIPDSTVFVPFSVPGTRLRVSVPEGWSRSAKRGVITFTDKLNSIGIQVVPQPKAPTVASARKTELPKLASSVSHYTPGSVSTVTRRSGPAVLVTYQQDSAMDPVTGKVVRDAVERYEFWHAGKEAVLTLSGPVGADNVDPWRTVTDSVAWK
jgi:hypothetical protein